MSHTYCVDLYIELHSLRTWCEDAKMSNVHPWEAQVHPVKLPHLFCSLSKYDSLRLKQSKKLKRPIRWFSFFVLPQCDASNTWRRVTPTLFCGSEGKGTCSETALVGHLFSVNTDKGWRENRGSVSGIYPPLCSSRSWLSCRKHWQVIWTPVALLLA